MASETLQTILHHFTGLLAKFWTISFLLFLSRRHLPHWSYELLTQIALFLLNLLRSRFCSVFVSNSNYRWWLWNFDWNNTFSHINIQYFLYRAVNGSKYKTHKFIWMYFGIWTNGHNFGPRQSICEWITLEWSMILK